VRYRADLFLKALGSARQPFFLLFAQKKEGKEKAMSPLGVGSQAPQIENPAG
jgi:hypothetical protein